MSANHAHFGSFDGERKLATVLFADIAESARLIDGADPEDADDRLLPVLQVMIDVVQRFGGTVNQVLGDGIMALFGAPRALEDHALRACLAAQEIHVTAGRLQGVAPLADGLPIDIRLGLSTGEMVIKPADEDFGLKFRAVGEAVYLARRLEDAAPPGGTLLSRSTLNLVSEQVRAQPYGTVRLKDDSQPVESLQLTAIDLGRTDMNCGAREPATSFVGRARELGVLKRHLDGVESDAGCALVLTGDAGIGKSRLVTEFLCGLQRKGYPAIRCDLLPTGLARPFETSAQIVRSLLARHRAGPGEDLEARVVGFLDSLQIRRRHARSAILELLGAVPRDRIWDGLDPPQKLQIAVEAVGEVLTKASRTRPIVVVLEDFHWADSKTRLLAEELAARVGASRVLMIVTSRNHHDKTWSGWPQVKEHEIQPLSRAQTSAFLESLLGPGRDLEELKGLLAEKTQGNPFFVEECVRALEESGSLFGVPGAYALAVPVAALEIPRTVRDVLAARIDALPRSDREVLLCAAVIGQRADVGLLREIHGLPREELLAVLSQLQQAGFLEQTRIMPNLEYGFRHALIHDVAYDTVLRRRRRELHAQVMAAIERRRMAQLPGKFELLAHHAYHAKIWPKAYAYCRRAGRDAQTKTANQEAAVFFERALKAVAHGPDTFRYACRELELRLELVQSLLPIGRHAEGRRQLLAAQELAETISDERRLANVASASVPYYWMRGDLEQAVHEGTKALEMAERLNYIECEIQAATRLGGINLHRGNYASACELMEATIGKIPPADSANRFGLFGVALACNRGYLACALGELGRFEEAIKVGDEGIRVAEEARHVFSQIFIYLFVSFALLRKGDFERSLPTLLRCFDLCKATRAKLLYPLSAASLGYAQVRMGDLSSGLELLEEAAASAQEHVIRFQLSHELTWLGEAYLLAGQTGKAQESASSALEYAQGHGEKGGEAWALWLLGEVQAQLGAGARAEDHLRAAREIAVARQMAPLVAHIDFRLGQVYRERHASAKARRATEDALSSFRRLGMTYWLEAADLELAGATVPLAVGARP